jgi:predicted DNA-binding transcriptional regulator YafY
MRRADRLFQIIQVLRRSRKPLTADAIAAELETSKRTIYRDIATLIEQRVPIRGEAGMGYILERGFDLPPLMLTPDEIEAAVLGAQWVTGHADAVLSRAAQDLIAKIADTVPERLRPFVLEPASRAAGSRKEPDRIDMARTRTQIHEGKKIALRYRDEHGRHSERTVWPIAIGYHEAVRILAAWCELRNGFSQLSHRPGHRCRLSRREISGAARPAQGEVAKESGLGASERCLISHIRELADQAFPR